jgi:hypothetical protein
MLLNAQRRSWSSNRRFDKTLPAGARSLSLIVVLNLDTKMVFIIFAKSYYYDCYKHT